MVYRLDETTGFAIHRVAMRLRAELTQRLRAHDLTAEQFGLLARLWEEDGISQRDLAERNYKDRPNVTRLLDRLVSKALVERRPHPGDRRAHHIYLTPKGHAIRNDLLPIAERMRADAYRGISAEEQRRLRRLLDRIHENLAPTADARPETAGLSGA